MDNHRLASIVRSLSERVDPGRVLRDVVKAAVEATESGHAVVVGAVDGEVTPLVVAGTLHPVLFEAARRAVAGGTPAHASDPEAGLDAWAVPMIDGTEVTAALGVAAPARRFDLTSLQPWADCALLAMAGATPGRASSIPTSHAATDLAERLASIAAETSPHGVMRRALEVAEACFGVRSAFACLVGGTSVEIAYYVGLSRDRLADAARHPGFAELVGGSVTRTRPPTDGVVARLAEGAEFAICLPIPAVPAGEAQAGAIVLFTGEVPVAERDRALEIYRLQVAAALRSALLGASLEQAGGETAGIVHAMPDPVLAVDGGGCFIAVNGPAAELFALAEPFEVGRSARGRLGHPDLEALLLGERAADLEVSLGRPTPTHWLAFARRVGSGRVLVLREALRARRGERDETEFVAAVGRELRRPLGVIREHLEGRPAGGTTLLRAVGAEVAQLEALADQLTLLGETGAISLRREPHDVVALARELAAVAEHHHPGRVVTVVAQPHRIEALVDRRALERAVRPLLDNALRYSDGPVGLEVADRGDAFEIAVIDSGPGIFSGDVPGLFERFHPLDGSPSRQGAGLGLSTARRMVEAMAGRIWCDTRLGVGSRFALRLSY